MKSIFAIAPGTMLILSAGAQTPNVGPTVRLDSGTSTIRWALEYSAVAHDHGVAMIWMEQPQEQSPFQRNMFGRAFSADCGTTWSVDNLHGSDGAEVDPPLAANAFPHGFARRSCVDLNRVGECIGGRSGLTNRRDRP